MSKGRSLEKSVGNTADLNSAYRKRNQFEYKDTDYCLYCKNPVSKGENQQINCEMTIHKLMRKVNDKLPVKARSKETVTGLGLKKSYHYSRWTGTMTEFAKEGKVKYNPIKRYYDKIMSKPLQKEICGGLLYGETEDSIFRFLQKIHGARNIRENILTYYNPFV